MANIQKSKVSTKQVRKNKAIKQAGFRQKSAAAGRQRWEVLVSGSEKNELKKLLAAIRKATTGSAPVAAQPATTGSVPAPATGSMKPAAQPATTGSVPAPATGSREWFEETMARITTTGSTPAPATGSAQKATSGSAGF